MRRLTTGNRDCFIVFNRSEIRFRSASLSPVSLRGSDGSMSGEELNVAQRTASLVDHA
jgi:hypothetical protein